MSSNPLPVSIIGGYLGSGKTTLINHLIRHSGQTRIAVLVNDFGELGIDADLIEADDGNVISLSGGCICCSYGNDLSMALMDVIALSPTPDHIVIESSGVALPGAIASSIALLSGLKLFGIVVLADAETIRKQATDRYVADTIDRQLSHADLVVLNKADLPEPAVLAKTKHWLTEHWPDTRLISATHSMIPISLLLDNPLIDKSTDTSWNLSAHVLHASAFHTFVVTPPANISAVQVARALASDSCALARAKGFIESSDGTRHLVQVVGSRWTVTSGTQDYANATNTGQIVCIGLSQTVDEDAIKSHINQLREQT